ncbi:Uncharacterized protein dnm_067350 [Desulfonema magnum]|uniref:Uncharacterized protein n=1 Tax=Desulfonema magnum TaxID=45655 RepID=A0A975GS33_9BACT|nr:Uncharacterized protein dnm_067350 [Desulfonema magnum]
MHQAKNAGRGLQPRPKRLFSGVGKYFGRGCKPRPADHGLIKTMSYDLSLMHMLCDPPGFLRGPEHSQEIFRTAENGCFSKTLKRIGILHLVVYTFS